MNIGIDHGYYAIKTRHFSFPADKFSLRGHRLPRHDSGRSFVPAGIVGHREPPGACQRRAGRAAEGHRRLDGGPHAPG